MAEKQQIFCTPYNTWSAERILNHYRTRSNVHFVPRQLNPEQVAVESINNLLANRFEFNGEIHQLPDNFDWTVNPSKNQDIEWMIAFHKFYFAADLGAYYYKTSDPRCLNRWIELTSRWIDTIPMGYLDTHVTGRRIENWITAYHYFIAAVATHKITPQFHLKFLGSLFQQVSYMGTYLTPAGNHRTIELMAIFITAVMFPEFKHAQDWLDFSRKELLKNLRFDLLADGVQCELSTHYHHIVLRNYLYIKKLASFNQITLLPEIDELLQKALDFAMYTHKPDGCIPVLSDGDRGSYLDLLEQGYQFYGNEAYLYVATQGAQGRAPGTRSATFPASGYTVLRSGWGDDAMAYADEHYLIFDCGPLGQGYFGHHHGHIDLLNIELAAYGQALIIDPARYTYHEPHPDSEEINWRARFRGTGFHNTVQVDGKDQIRYVFQNTGYKFRGPEPDHELRAFISEDSFDFVHGVARSHEYEAVHERKIFFTRPEYWIVSDFLLAEESHVYDLHYHLSELAWQKLDHRIEEETDLVYAPQLLMAQPAQPWVTTFIDEGYVSPAYGIKNPAPVVRYSGKATTMAFHTVLYPFEDEPPQITVQEVAVYHAGSKCSPAEAFALSIQIRTNEQQTNDLYFCAANADNHIYRFADIVFNGSLLLARQQSEEHTVFHYYPEQSKQPQKLFAPEEFTL
ncbi:MAG: alginate lyase family protein [Candidatus Promineifilaceae bacterium]|nr:alginate lyase family protein [Candidatus Promineifilaceae bacterium]